MELKNKQTSKNRQINKKRKQQNNNINSTKKNFSFSNEFVWIFFIKKLILPIGLILISFSIKPNSFPFAL